MSKGRFWAAPMVAGALALAGCAGPTPPERGTAGPVVPIRVDGRAASHWISAYRQAHGLPPVTEDAALDRAAEAQALAMARVGTISHTVAGPLPERLAAVGRGRGAAAENVSMGYHDVQAALGGWQRSPEHNANLLFRPARRIGIAGARAPGSRYKTFWALVFSD